MRPVVLAQDIRLTITSVHNIVSDQEYKRAPVSAAGAE